jgi:hypothetical protein
MRNNRKNIYAVPRTSAPQTVKIDGKCGFCMRVGLLGFVKNSVVATGLSKNKNTVEPYKIYLFIV